MRPQPGGRLREAARRFPSRTAVVAALILVAVSLPGSSLPDGPGIPGLDKAIHACMFLALALAVWFDFKPSGARGIAAAVAAGLAFAAFTELLQLAVEGRSTELIDGIADMAGYAAGLAASMARARLRGRAGAYSRR